MANGYNPMRWDCSTQGCFNKKCRPKIEVFAECFPRNINFSDIDGIVEINGNFLLLEWKSYAGNIPTGQKIMFSRMTQDNRFTVFIICGDAETMSITDLSVIWGGKQQPWARCTLEQLKERMTKWAFWAESKKLPS